MALPHTRTPVHALIAVGDAAAAFLPQHAASLSEELEEDHGGEAGLREAVVALREAEGVFVREAQEDRQVYTRREALLEQTHTALRGVRAWARRRLRRAEGGARALRAFRFGALSQVRSHTAALKVLTAARAAIEAHQAALDVGKARSATWLGRLSALETDLRANAADLARERQETRDAHTARDAARDALVDLLIDLFDAAESVAETHPEPIKALRLIFDTHLPASSSSSSAQEDEDEGEDDEDDGTDEPVPPVG